ncbi:MAG: hypothetical protein AB1758_16220 [Candidatus Eremiobacterota bacterium]
MIQDVQSLKSTWAGHVPAPSAKPQESSLRSLVDALVSGQGDRPEPLLKPQPGLVAAAAPLLAGSSLLLGGYPLMAGVVGTVGGLAASVASFGGRSGVEITRSGVEERWSVERKGTDSLRAEQFTLPDGTVVDRVEMRAGGDVHYAVAAVGADGAELSAELARDPLSGREVIRVSNANGSLTELDPGSLSLTLAAPRRGVGTFERMPQRQTLHPDGSMEFILNEESRYTTRSVPDPLRLGESVTETIPDFHGYQRVHLSPQGDASAELVLERFGDNAGQEVKPLWTGLSTAEEIRLLSPDGQQVDSFTPFVSRNRVEAARQEAVQRQVDRVLGRLGGDPSQAWLVPGHQPGHLLVTAPGADRVFEVSPEGDCVPRFVTGGVASEPLQGDSGLFVLTQAGKLQRLDGPGWEVQVGTDVVGSPSFDADGNVHVVSRKGERLVSRSITPDGEMTSRLVS